MSADHLAMLRESLENAAAWRKGAAEELSDAIQAMNACVRAARDAGMSAIEIAEAIGTTRQRVYEILRHAGYNWQG